tara:strand:+ start:723 stop:1466 length:744 start_codon:yes stop_codon:yes gene_type:complete
MGTSLASKTIGGGDQAFKWYLHTSGASLGGVTRISNGNGDDTGLLLSGSEIGIHNGSAITIFNGLATSDRSIDFPDASGTVVLGNGSGVTDSLAFRAATGRTVAKLASDSSSTSLTAAEIGSFSFTPSASKTYSFHLILRVDTAATSTAAVLRLLGPTVDFVTYRVTAPSGAAGISHEYQATHDALDEAINPGAFYDASGQGIVQIQGIVKLPSGTPASNFRLSLASEVASSQVSVLEGSAMIFEQL